MQPSWEDNVSSVTVRSRNQAEPATLGFRPSRVIDSALYGA